MKRLQSKPTVFKNLGTNFMTPYVDAYYKVADGVYAEISHGEGFNHDTIYGVTIRPDDNYKLSKGGFRSMKEALNHLDYCQRAVQP